jgi:hypothetical protein
MVLDEAAKVVEQMGQMELNRLFRDRNKANYADYRIMPTGVRRVDARSGESRVGFAA